MTAVAEASSPGATTRLLVGAAPWRALAAALLLAGLLLGAATSVPDVTWLLYAGEKMLQGQRLYEQVLEVNPPLAVLIYLPAIGLARPLGLPPEAVAASLCMFAAVASLWLAGRILRPLTGEDPILRAKLAAAGAFVLGVMPMAAFGQREHIAVIALTPFLATCVVRAERRAPPPGLALAAGIGLGIALCLKPHFAAVAAAPALWALWRSGRWSPWRQAELWTGAVLVAGYALLILLVFPGFLSLAAPLARDAYLPIRTPFWLLLILPGVPLALAAALVGGLMKLDPRWLAAPLLASLGGGLAFMAQGKGWPYHAYPMLAFAALGLLAAGAMASPTRARTWTGLDRAMLLAPGLAAAVWLSANVDSAALARQVAALGPHPRLIAVSGNLGVGMPTARAVRADWIGSQCSEWVSDGVLRMEEAGGLSPAHRARLEGLMRDERSRLSRDIVLGRPDVVLFDRKRFDWRAWAMADPGIAASLAGYRLAATVNGIEVWGREGR